MSTQINGFNIIQPTINFGIIGCVSSGKSTLLNSLFCDTYSDMKIKRTTMIPQVYQCDPKIEKNKTYAKEIRKQNEEINKKFIEQTENKKALTIEDCYEKVYKLPPIENFIKLPSNINAAIFDIPGLNDSQTKNIYFQYLNQNFYKFDYILFVIDIQSALNTSDEMDILKLIKQNILDIKKKYNKDIKLLVVCNKCDDMEVNDKGELELYEPELEEMYDQIITILKNELSNIIKYDTIKYSAQNTYIYRMVADNKSLDLKDLDKIGRDQFGSENWREFKKGSTEEELITILKKKINFTVKLTKTGYAGLIEKINKSLTSIPEILLSKVNVIEDIILKKEKEFNKVNTIFNNIYSYIKEIKSISKDIDIDKILTNIKEFWHNILSLTFPFTSITSENHTNIKTNYYGTLISQKQKYIEIKFTTYIDNYIDKETTYFVSNLDNIILTSYSFDKVSQTLTNIFENEGELPIDKIVKCIYKIPINDIYNLILKLEDYDVSYEDSSKIYMNYYKNYKYNISSEINKINALLLSKLYMKEYITTNNINYSLLSLIVKNQVLNPNINYDFLNDNLEKDIDTFLEPFKKFIQYINRGSSEIDLLSINNERKTKSK